MLGKNCKLKTKTVSRWQQVSMIESLNHLSNPNP